MTDTDRNIAIIPCPECKREGDDYLVEAYVPDYILKEYGVDNADDMDEDELYDLHDVSMPRCFDCGSEYDRDEEGNIIND